MQRRGQFRSEPTLGANSYDGRLHKPAQSGLETQIFFRSRLGDDKLGLLDACWWS